MGSDPIVGHIRKSFRDEYLDDLVEGGELTTSLSESGGTVYRLGR